MSSSSSFWGLLFNSFQKTLARYLKKNAWFLFIKLL